MYSKGLPKRETFYYTLSLKSMTNCLLSGSLKHGPLFDCRLPHAGAGKVGALKARKGVASGRKANTSRLLALMFSLRGFFPFFILERRWAKGQLLSDWHMRKLWVIQRESSFIHTLSFCLWKKLQETNWTVAVIMKIA